MSWLYTVLFAGLVFSGQDSGFSAFRPESPESPAVVVKQDETERFSQTYPLNPNGRVRISNVNGSITVEGWDRSEVRLEYTKIADTKERLSDVEIRIDSRPEFFTVESDHANLKMRNNDQWKNGGKLTVDYRLMVPRGAVLNEVETVNGSITVSNFVNVTRVSAVNGSVKATNIRGTARLSTVNGEVAADFDRLESGSKISLDTVNGKVNLLIPSDSNATVKADSLNGSITNDFGLPVRKGKYVGRDLYGRIGSGEVDIKLNSVNGSLSIGRKNDGKSPSPATDLLPQKQSGEDDWNEVGVAKINTAELNREINKEAAKAVRDSVRISRKAMTDAQVKLEQMRPEIERITAKSVEHAAKAGKLGDLSRHVAIAERAQREAISKLSNAAFFPGLPRVEKKSGSFTVKGTPKVTIDAKGCSVSVRGWDKSEVQYRVTQYSTPNANPIDIKESHSDSSVTVTVVNADAAVGGPLFTDQSRTRIEIYVPRKSNLKIDATGEIRIEGVSGDVQLAGLDESINVRDVEGKLSVSSSDGRVRVIGFTGDIDVRSQDGPINLEGDFRTLNAVAKEGTVILTLPAAAGADIDVSGGEVRGEGIIVTRIGGDGSQNKYRLGSGGRKYRVETEGEILVRASDLIAEVF